MAPGFPFVGARLVLSRKFHNLVEEGWEEKKKEKQRWKLRINKMKNKLGHLRKTWATGHEKLVHSNNHWLPFSFHNLIHFFFISFYYFTPLYSLLFIYLYCPYYYYYYSYYYYYIHHVCCIIKAGGKPYIYIYIIFH